MTIFELAAKLLLDKTDFDKGVDESESSFKGLGATISSVVSTSVSVVKALGSAMADGAKQVWTLANETSKYGDNVDKMSQKIGISKQAYQEWQYVFDRSGASVDGLQMGMKTLSNVIVQAGSGSEEAQKKLAALGLSYDDLKNKTPEEQLQIVISKLQGMGEGAARTAAASNLLGRSATDMAAVLNMTAEETQELIDEVHSYGMAMSDTAVSDSAAFQDSITKAQYTMRGMKNSIVSEMLPGLTMLTNGFSDLLAGADSAFINLADGIIKFTNGISNAITKIVPIITQVLDALGDMLPFLMEMLISKLSELATTIAPIAVKLINTLVTAITSVLPSLIQTGVNIIMTLVQGIVNMLPTIADAAVKIIVQLINSITANIPKLIQAALQIINTLVNTLIAQLPTIIKAGLDLIVGLAKGIISALPQIIQSVLSLLTSIDVAIYEAIPMIVDAGFELLTSLVDELPRIITTVVAAIPNIINSLLNAIMSSIPKLVESGFKLLTSLIDRLPSIITTICQAIPKIITGIIGTIAQNLPKIIETGVKLFVSLITKLPQAIWTIVSHLPEIIWAIVQGLMSGFGSIVEVGKMLVEGLWQGIKNMGNWLWNQLTGWFGWIIDGIRWLFGISSPSKVFAGIGKQLDAGLGKGITDNADLATKPLEDLAQDINGVSVTPTVAGSSSLASGSSGLAGANVTININGANANPEEIAREVQKVFVDWERQREAVFA